uniref:DDE-1 domain-containing protein n=1 Tax=Amphimedon queenslandica TaxID=400682 RepID=A0A1X7UK74_AMPQE
MARHPLSQECNGGHFFLKKGWAKCFLKEINFVKRKATTKGKVSVENIDELERRYLIDIKAAVPIDDIPHDLVLNWDQTGLNYAAMSQWTMEKEVSKRVEVAGINDKRQIIAVFAWSITGNFLPMQFVYQGNTYEETMILYIQSIIILYLAEKCEALNLPPSQLVLDIIDKFQGRTTESVLKLLIKNNILYVIVPPNCTDRLQPLDLSLNKAAKNFLRSQFQSWYANKIYEQLKQDKCDPVDLRLTVMKTLGAKWIMELSRYIRSKPTLIINAFKEAGIIDAHQL